MGTRRFIPSFTVVGLILFLGASQAGANAQVELIQLLSPRVAKQFLGAVEWKRYEATRINIGTFEAWESPAIFLDLKGDEWKVVFPNDRFLSPGIYLGDIANPRPVSGDLKKAALELLEHDLVLVYRVRVNGPQSRDRAIVLTPYTIKGAIFEDTIRLKLDNNALQRREQDHH